MQDAYRLLAEAGTTRDRINERMTSFAEFNRLIGMEAMLKAEERLTRREGDKLTVRVRGQTKKV